MEVWGGLGLVADVEGFLQEYAVEAWIVLGGDDFYYCVEVACFGGLAGLVTGLRRGVVVRGARARTAG